MYLEYFNIHSYPFAITPNTEFYCELETHQNALLMLTVCLEGGEGFVKIIGEVGSGKTLLCRLLLDILEKDYVTAYIPNPDLTPNGLRAALARELGIEVSENPEGNNPFLVDKINEKLLSLYAQGKKVVLLIDEAQALSLESLEALRLLTNLETEKDKLMQVVLFAQPELEEKLADEKMRQLRQRITFSYHLEALEKNELEPYLCHRLAKSGYTYGQLFTKQALQKLYQASQGVPRLINILCHKAMLVAYGRGEQQITQQAINQAIDDTETFSETNSAYAVLFLIAVGLCSLLLILSRIW